ncbi:MAG: GreA/GreB family elongation factor [Bdellovibrionales bacterium]|nr:GreA/GreB family elongation factor [Bdellovibrionales bacterium]
MKQELLNELIGIKKEEMHNLESAAKANKDFATDQEFKAESKYDTRSLEAGYLASAELSRVEDLKLEIQMLEEVDLTIAKRLDEICIGSLVELRHKDQERTYFLIPTAGGTLLKVGARAVLVVSVFSPLGDALLGLKAGDEFEVETPKETRHYKILNFQ